MTPTNTNAIAIIVEIKTIPINGLNNKMTPKTIPNKLKITEISFKLPLPENVNNPEIELKNKPKSKHINKEC